MQKIITNYTFNSSLRTITFNDYVTTGISIERIKSIHNLTLGGTPLYLSKDDGYTSATGTATANVLTLTKNYAGMHDTDKLRIVYDDPNDIFSLLNGVISASKLVVSTAFDATIGLINTNLATLTSIVSGGKGLVTETNSASIKYNLDLMVNSASTTAKAFETLTIDNTSGGKSLTSSKYGTNTKALITAETAQMRFTIDGTAPTATNGHILNIYDIIQLNSLSDITNFRAIRTGTTSGTLMVTYSL